MEFLKYFYGSREVVVFIDESGDPTLNDPENPIFVLGACATFGGDIESVLRKPWLEVRAALTGSEDTPTHMKKLHRRATKKNIQKAVDFFEKSSFKRISFTITNKTVFENGEIPKSPVLELALEHILKSIAGLMNGDIPAEGISIIFEDGPLIDKIKPHWPRRILTRNDGVKIPVSWSVLDKSSLEPGLEIADFIAHSTSGYFRHNKHNGSKFAERYLAIHPPNKPDISKGLELNEAEFVGWTTES